MLDEAYELLYRPPIHKLIIPIINSHIPIPISKPFLTLIK